MISQLLKDSLTSPDARYNYMHPHTSKLFHLFLDFEEQSKEEFVELFKRKTLPKGTYLLKRGEVSKKCYFIEKGVARTFYTHGMEETTIYFSFPYEFVDSYQSSALKMPSSVDIQLLSSAVVYEFDWEALNRFKAKYPVVWKIEELIIVCLVAALEAKLVNMQSMNAQERYEELLRNHKQLIKSVSLSHIANYIGCSPECISRIRSKYRLVV
ncbi:MAG TPA: Crp/Fnr family transcriptional regulator [Paludibacter sp.]|nr:Crp/Fnr family transcriptional regulator [Paludibacter sp.]